LLERVGEISRTDLVRSEDLLHIDREEKNILHAVKVRKANWIVQILCGNCLITHVIEGKIEGIIEDTRR